MSIDCRYGDESRTAGQERSGSVRRAVAAVVLLLAVLYPLSLGPVCWTMTQLDWGRRHPGLVYGISRFYQPLAPAVIYGPPFVQKPMRWWIGVGMTPPTVYDSLPDGIVWTNPGYSYTLWHY